MLFAGLLVAGHSFVRCFTVVAPPLDAGSIHSLAVMPFETMGGRSGYEYLGLGIADPLITRLSNTGKILVRPTSAIEQYRNSTITPQAAGKKQKVDAILDGHIQRDGSRVRMTVQMIRVSDGTQLWAPTFDEAFTNAFDMEDQVSERVARSIRLQLTARERDRFLRRATDNPKAYDAFVKGRYYWNKRTNEGLEKGLGYFREAIRLDPGFAEGYEGVADSYASLGCMPCCRPNRLFRPPARPPRKHSRWPTIWPTRTPRLAWSTSIAFLSVLTASSYLPPRQNVQPALLFIMQLAFDSNRNYVMAHSLLAGAGV